MQTSPPQLYKGVIIWQKLLRVYSSFSEGHNQAVIKRISSTAKKYSGVTLLDYSSECQSQPASLLVGDEESLFKSGFQLVIRFWKHWLMTKLLSWTPSYGGGADVCPFVPVKDITTAECVEIANKVAEHRRELGIPIFLYEDACSSERKNLAKVRKDNLKECQKNCWKEDWKPDYGERNSPTKGLHRVGCHSLLSIISTLEERHDLEIQQDF